MKSSPSQEAVDKGLNWTVTPDGYRIWCEKENRIVAVVAHNYRERTERAASDARLIVDAVNFYNPAVEALKQIAEMHYSPARLLARSVISLFP